MFERIFNFIRNRIRSKAARMAAEAEASAAVQNPTPTEGQIAKEKMLLNVSYLFQCLEVLEDMKLQMQRITQDNTLNDVELDYFDEVASQINSTILQITAKVR